MHLEKTDAIHFAPVDRRHHTGAAPRSPATHCADRIYGARESPPSAACWPRISVGTSSTSTLTSKPVPGPPSRSCSRVMARAHFRRLESTALASALGRTATVLALGGGTPELLTNRLLLEQTPGDADRLSRRAIRDPVRPLYATADRPSRPCRHRLGSRTLTSTLPAPAGIQAPCPGHARHGKCNATRDSGCSAAFPCKNSAGPSHLSLFLASQSYAYFGESTDRPGHCRVRPEYHFPSRQPSPRLHFVRGRRPCCCSHSDGS